MPQTSPVSSATTHQRTKGLLVQTTALSAGRHKPGFAYYMEMGLGKTWVTLEEFAEMVEAGLATRLVVICPNSFKTGWVDEIKKHGFDFEAFVYNSGSDYENTKFLKTEFKRPPVLIINYEAIRKEGVQEYITAFTNKRNCMIALDESIQIKTHNSLQTKAALSLGRLFRYRRILSGKPITQGPHDLWAQMTFIGAITARFFPFKTTFCKMGGFKGKKVVGAQNEELLADTIGKFIFKAEKKDWTDLPPKVYTSREYQLTPELSRQYRSMEEDFVLWINDNENVSVDVFITKYIKLAQIQSGFIIKDDGSVKELVPADQNPRFKLVKEIIEETNGKVIIPYIHRYTYRLLFDMLQEYNPSFIIGNMQPTEIQAQKDKFNNDATSRVILVQTRAGKYGHTLLGGEDLTDKCSTMVFAENSYSLDDRSQIEDRMHRHGQTLSCLYIDVWGTRLDKAVTKALQDKENISQAVMQHFGKKR